MKLSKKIAALVGLCLWAVAALAHELPANRATLILRDGSHLSLVLYTNYPEALHQALAPQQSQSAFELAYSSMAAPELAQALQRAQAKFQASTQLVLANGRTATLTHWRWPAAGEVQKQLQQRVMQALVAPRDHPAHEEPLEIRAELSGPSLAELAKLKLRLPAEFGEVLLVYYQPKQVWLKPQTLSPEIRF
jgi:hypothetical protein